MGSARTGTMYVFCDGSTGGPPPGAASPPPAPPATPAMRRAGEVAAGCGAAAVAFGADGHVLGWEVQALPRMTNNEAEYAGLLLGIGLATRLQGTDTVFVLDSATVAGQMAGRCAVNSAGLRRWHWRACEALRSLPRAAFCTVPREWNRAADGLAAQVGLAWPALREHLARQMSPKEVRDGQW